MGDKGDKGDKGDEGDEGDEEVAVSFCPIPYSLFPIPYSLFRNLLQTFQCFLNMTFKVKH
jgi:hypothetical protein